MITKDKATGVIHLSQKEYAEGLKPLPRARQPTLTGSLGCFHDLSPPLLSWTASTTSASSLGRFHDLSALLLLGAIVGSFQSRPPWTGWTG